MVFCTAAMAQTLTGVVTNKTTNKPAAGDDVVLLKLAQGMQELARTKTDSKGHFTIKVPSDEAGSLHLVRVTHDRANYFEPAPAGAQSVAVEVYTAAAELEGVSVAEDVLQIQTTPDGNTLRVIEHFLLRNESQPQKTLFSDHPFEVYLPNGAKVDGAAAKAPGGMGVEQPLVPMGDPDHYAIIFPIRPGETEFTVWYRMPYKDSFTFAPRPVMPTEAMGIMMPKSMSFKSGSGVSYTSVSDQVGGKAQAWIVSNVKPSQPLGFTVSGKGELPRDTTVQAKGAQADASGSTATSGDPNSDTRPGGGLGTPLDNSAERESWVSKYKLWIIGAFVLAMAAGAGLMLRNPGSTAGSPVAAGPASNSLQVLRDELFAIETDRLEGRLTEREYAELKAAYDVVLRRALARSGARTGTEAEPVDIAG
jgi:5-hydroxyisourate hydrolase-like protein (transthyretin family)